MGISSFVIVIDTLCEGWQAQEDAAGSPFLYSTIEEAEAEILDTFTMMNEGREASGEDLEEESEEFVVPVSEYIKGRKAIFYGELVEMKNE